MKKLFSRKPPPCPCCGTVVIYTDGTPPNNIDIKATCDMLINRCSNGEMTVIRGDCPLEMMMDLLEAETVYNIVQFLSCNICGETIFWGLCIRGIPIYKCVKKKDVDNYPWDDKRKH